jgi:acylphosphatase
MKRMRVNISGIVQGVCFRAATRRTAANLNLTGWVRNIENGRVEAIFEGEDSAIDEMIDWCKVGPPAARVEKVILSEEPCTGEFPDFSIRYGK